MISGRSGGIFGEFWPTRSKRCSRFDSKTLLSLIMTSLLGASRLFFSISDKYAGEISINPAISLNPIPLISLNFLIYRPNDSIESHEGSMMKAQVFTCQLTSKPRKALCQEKNLQKGFTGPLSRIVAQVNLDEFVKSQNPSVFVIPANAGIQGYQVVMDSCFRGGDGFGDFLRDHQH